MIRDQSNNTLASLLNLPLGEPNEFDVIILQPFRIFLAQGFSVYGFVVVDQIPYKGLFYPHLLFGYYVDQLSLRAPGSFYFNNLGLTKVYLAKICRMTRIRGIT